MGLLMRRFTRFLSFGLVMIVIALAVLACQSQDSKGKSSEQPKATKPKGEPPQNTQVSVMDIQPNQDPIRKALGGRGPRPIEDPRAKHGDNAILRARNHLPDQTESETEFTLQEVDWSKAYPLTFLKLKRNYQYYVVKQHFAKQGLPRVHGGAVTLVGAVMPFETPGEDGKMSRFWLANPTVVMAGCVFCNPPTLADLVYVETKEPIKVDREDLYRGIVRLKILGRFFLGAEKTKDGAEYIYKIELKEVLATL